MPVKDNLMVNIGNVSHVTIDNFEIRGYYWNVAGPVCALDCGIFDEHNSGTGKLLTNLYVHGWSYGPSADYGPHVVDMPNGATLDHSIVDGSDTHGGGDSFGISYYGGGTFTHNYFTNISNFVLYNDDTVIKGNTFANCVYGVFGDDHANMIEDTGGGTAYVANNVIHDSAPGCEAYFAGGNSTSNEYVWDNIWYNLHSNPPELDPGGASYWWNNTIVVGGGYCLKASGHPGTSTGPIVYENNHCITRDTGAPGTINGVTVTADHNVLQSPTAASAQGYSSNQTYAYSPTSSGDSTVHAGMDLSSKCNGALASLCMDTSYACGIDGTHHVVVCPGRVTVARPRSAAWDAGAYEMG
jgi:hypothetical protein